MKRRWLTILICSLCAFNTASGQYIAHIPENTTRSWIGPEYFANRLQDWRIDGGRIECIEARDNLPVRTLHLLTHSLKTGGGTFEMSVKTGAIENNKSLRSDAWTGFLIGVGGDHVDYRISSLVHHKPAEDGGLLAVMQGNGKLAIHDFTKGGSGGTWSVSGPINPDDLPLFQPTNARGDGFSATNPLSIDLFLRATQQQDGAYMLIFSAIDSDSRDLISEVTCKNIDPALVDGNIALVSHKGPQGGQQGFWFSDWRVVGTKVAEHPDHHFGPIISTLYTLGKGTIKLTAQFPPLAVNDIRQAELQFLKDDGWQTVSTGSFIENSCTIPFRIEDYDAAAITPYRVVYNYYSGEDLTTQYSYEGIIRAEPLDKDEIVVGALTCNKVFTGGLKWNSNGIWFPHTEIVESLKYHNPDLLYFSGDQIYESDLTPAHANPPEKTMLDYLYKWYRWCWTFRDVTRNTPTVCIPDDHDVYHGNLWGAGGKAAKRTGNMTAQDSGGYKQPAWFVNAVHATQTSHLPDPVDPMPVQQGISVYYTNMNYAGISFAIISDRQWKSSPTVAVPEGKFVNGWPQNPEFDPVAQADTKGAVLLGERQLEFLEQWAADWSDGVWMKVLLSQSVFTNIATIPRDAKGGGSIPGIRIPMPGEYIDNQKLATDGDSNGWPQTGRNNAVRAIRKAFAIHLAGDQHLGATLQYGVDDWRDGGFAFSTPSIANTWPRRWYPPMVGENREPDSPKYTGDFKDGFGNLLTVYAVSNPEQVGQEPARLYNRAPGYGIVRFSRSSREIIIESWPRWVDPAAADAQQYPGWPILINQIDNFNPPDAKWFLPRIEVKGVTDPVLQVIDELTEEIIYTIRISGTSFVGHVPSEGKYTVLIRGENNSWRKLNNIDAVPPKSSDWLQVDF